MTDWQSQNPEMRLASVDGMRGLVVLLLVPDIGGGLSLHHMASRFPEDPVWQALGSAFSHVDWQGASIWDMVMPVFMFVAGMSLALSVDRRRAQGQGQMQLLANVLLRCACLVVLGLILPAPRVTLLDNLLPYVILATTLPWTEWLARAGFPIPGARPRRLEAGLTFTVLVLVAWRYTHPVDRLGDYDLLQILTQIGLATLLTFVAMGRDIATPIARSIGLAALCTLAFVAYRMSAYHGSAWSDAWQKGANLAADFDLWFMNQLPRAHPYRGDPHDYHTLQFVPVAANMLSGVAVARLLRSASPAQDGPVHRLSVVGLICLAGSFITVLAGIPLVKSLWTASWMLFSVGACLLVTAGFVRWFDRTDRHRSAFGLAILGSNALLLYVISYVDCWRIIRLGDQLTGGRLGTLAWAPLLQSLWVLGCLWMLAYVLHKARIRVRL